MDKALLRYARIHGVSRHIDLHVGQAPCVGLTWLVKFMANSAVV